MAKKKSQRALDWQTLDNLIRDYAEARVAESWKGGGDPADIPVVEANEVLTKARLDAHITKMQREEE